MFTMPQNVNAMTIVHHIVHTLVLVGQGEPRGVRQREMALLRRSSGKWPRTSPAVRRAFFACFSLFSAQLPACNFP